MTTWKTVLISIILYDFTYLEKKHTQTKKGENRNLPHNTTVILANCE